MRLAFILLVIEAVDEFADGLRRAVWPLIRNDLNIDYAHIGILLGLPSIIAGVIEPFIGIIGDVYNRKKIILTGGAFFALSFLLISLSHDFLVLLIAFILFYPSSGTFVGLSQATLMDMEPSRREHNMALWTLAGSIGVLLGPLALSLGGNHGMGWRQLFFMLSLFSVILVVFMRRFTMASSNLWKDKVSFKTGIADALRSLKNTAVVRWLVLLKLSDLMLIVMVNSGWYPVLKAHLYKAMPGKSGTVMTLGSMTNIIAGLFPLLLGIMADQWGLKVTLWILLLAPVSLIVGIPKQKNIDITSTNSGTETTR